MVVLLPHLFIYLTPLELIDLFISSINYLTFSSTSLSLSPHELPDLFIFSINYLTFSSTSLSLSPLELLDLFISSINYLTFSSTSLSLSPLEFPDLFISLINCTPNFLFKSYAGIFFLVSIWSLQFYCCLSFKGVFFPLWFLIDFARFHAFIYLFIWFFCSAQYFYFLAFGVLCSVGFIILQFLSFSPAMF